MKCFHIPSQQLIQKADGKISKVVKDFKNKINQLFITDIIDTLPNNSRIQILLKYMSNIYKDK